MAKKRFFTDREPTTRHELISAYNMGLETNIGYINLDWVGLLATLRRMFIMLYALSALILLRKHSQARS